ncbi:TauD/TfdA dioxygenase family protein [Sphingomonas tabacisoli]|uniref:TauD/TfdA dioxygenase family protein n=1 Tax=Sphingomonas tabacisoli TaxID=2249466 RepID=A0ABW4I5P4_9SPHN
MATAIESRLGLRHEPIKPSIASRVLNPKEELLSGDLGPAIRELLEERGVLVFPEIGFDDAEQIAFTETLGKYAPEGKGDGPTKITLDAKESASAEYLKGSLYWHIDGTMNDVPILASLLSCKVPSPKGTGNTGFCNTYAAWDALPAERKAELSGLRAIHAVWPTLFYYEPEPPAAKIKGMASVGENELPLVWKHQSGRESLVIGCTTQRIIGKEPVESAIIIHGLREWATREEFSYSHEWSVGDLVMWDNTGTMHRAEAYDPTCGRMMHRTKLEGEEPFE